MLPTLLQAIYLFVGKMSMTLSEYVRGPLEATLGAELVKQHCCSAGGGDAQEGTVLREVKGDGGV